MKPLSLKQTLERDSLQKELHQQKQLVKELEQNLIQKRQFVNESSVTHADFKEVRDMLDKIKLVQIELKQAIKKEQNLSEKLKEFN